MNKITIPFGMQHWDDLLAFVGTDRSTFRNAPQPYTFREHGHEWIAKRIDERVILTHTDKYAPHTNVFVFDTYDEFDQFIKSRNPKGDYDIENGGKPFGYQRNPGAARARIEATIANKS